MIYEHMPAPTIYEQNEEIATLRAKLAVADGEIKRLRALLAAPTGECTHQCRECLHTYSADGDNEDCPACGHDGTGDDVEVKP